MGDASELDGCFVSWWDGSFEEEARFLFFTSSDVILTFIP